jgi:hypothetical protein
VSLLAALTSAALHFIPADHANELAANLAGALVDGYEPVRKTVQAAVNVRKTLRSEGALVLPEDTDFEGLVEALIEATDDVAPRVCNDCGGFSGCDFCSERAA